MKLKKILALAGVAILALLYIITLISALLTSPATPQLFKACILASFVVPVFLYGYLLIYRLMKERADAAKRDIDEKIKKGAASDEFPNSSEPPVSP